ncbi:SDR family NAD(P)-dependent oxidoreductase [Streptomyces alkaliphilus]|uniref:SDR family NAD(P)-dependent oxidoreductase n=1 Tax=Streptomyces alkaliphilus TaxID=1472722 RepID=A0A7W3XZM8_9ACTN|nr:SDR family NAD(P)-dependent oxidoreductase [Streptomyces alkaliphilus]MBB0242724.1 SDR family NAD(P)-dependent oxidoreductase [Streptomyces alkaliphilus]
MTKATEKEAMAEAGNNDRYESAVALVGMAGRFPGAPDVASLWRNVLADTGGLRKITTEELTAAGVPPERAADPHYVAIGAPVDGIADFDAGVFGFSPREAETMDPQHRLFLECCWEALESAGYPPVGPPGATGVFGGAAFPDYLMDNVSHVVDEPGGRLLIGVGNERDSLTSLVAYKLGLRGPSLSVQTFCSTSLIAVHLACQSLLTFDSDMALAGGAFLPLPQPTGYLFEPGGITSPRGRVRSFDAAADGTVMGSGVGVVALKRMSDALADGDLVHAVILASAVNNDGRDKVGYTAPGVDGQADVIRTAMNVAEVDPRTVGYVECHATGTALGDGIELAAMGRVFRETPETPAVLGTAKPTLGHLDRAAGVAGLIRAALAVREGVRPGVPGFERPNPALAAAADRFTVRPETEVWPAQEAPRRAGVSSFGLGGTNAHVVLEQAPPRPPRSRPHHGPHLLTFSAPDRAALDALTERLRAHLAERAADGGTGPAGEVLDPADVAFTLQMSRGHFAVRRTVVCTDLADAAAALADPSRWTDGESTRRDPTVVLTIDPAAPTDWWDELARVTGGVPSGEGAAGVLGAVTEWLRGLGIRVATTTADGAADEDTLTVAVGPGPRGTPAAHWPTALLGRLWPAGAEVDWAALHHGEGRRVELPTYPFRRQRYWVEARPRTVAGSVEEPETRVDDLDRWTYLPVWKRRPLPVADLDERLRAAGPWLVLSGDERTEALVRRLERAGAEVVAARPGAAFGPDDSGGFTVRAECAESLTELLTAQFVAPRTIVHGLAAGAPEGDGSAHFTAELERGMHSVLALVKALAADPFAPPSNLALVTAGASEVAGADLRHPEHAASAALAPTIAQENPHLTCRHLDLDPEPGAAADPDATEQALAALVHPHEGPAAVRSGELWVRDYQQRALPAPDPALPPFRPGETVLITGGLGDVGLVLARHLASRYGCRLVLTSRSPLPPRERWAELADDGGRSARHVRNVLELEASGAEVLAVGADVGDEERMRAVVAAADARFGGIDVVVHAAGVQDTSWFKLAHLSDRECCDVHLHAKVRGFHTLQAVLGDRARDRRITLSSLSAVLGGIALGPYAAGNAALDAYTRRARLRGEGRWVTVDWDTWAIDPERLEGHNPQVQTYRMTAAEGVEILERALTSAGGISRVVISSGPIGPRLTRWVTGVEEMATAATEDGERHPRPELPTPYAEPAEGVETTIAETWAAVLGLEKVGADDDFFELGGHSMLAIQLSARLRAALGADLVATDLVEHPTVRRLTERLAPLGV